jgi:2-polyprenyl-3-methyl-5-hydroxy-6-metoxy-1,4-benzoquinol methylase
VLDIGCGTGYLTKYLSTKVYKIIGLDISNELIDYLKQFQSSSLFFCCENICNLNYSKKNSGKFTKIYSVHAFEHISNPQKFFKAIFELLVEGGSSLVIFPNSAKHGRRYFLKTSELNKLISNSNLKGKICVMKPTKVYYAVSNYYNKLRYWYRKRRLMDFSTVKNTHEFDKTIYFMNINKTKYVRILLSLFFDLALKVLKFFDFYKLFKSNGHLLEEELAILLYKNRDG